MAATSQPCGISVALHDGWSFQDVSPFVTAQGALVRCNRDELDDLVPSLKDYQEKFGGG